MFTRRDFMIGLSAALAACASKNPAVSAAAPEAPGYPYHPLLFQLDLAVLSYQMYGQSLVWPFDPYYESQSGRARAEMMQQVWRWAKEVGPAQAAAGSSLDHFRGPGVLGGFAFNEAHDPIVYRYGQLHPWRGSIAFPGAQWVEYMTPTEITGRIKDVYVAYRRAGGDEAEVLLDPIVPIAPVVGRDDSAEDTLLCFEGGTGGKEVGAPHSQSLMGCVLCRRKAGGSYDVHIAFRGSRCGSPARAIRQAMSDDSARGNPDWITDMGYNRISPGLITTTGPVSRGFATSMAAILPQLMACLEHIAAANPGAPPDQITVTGHSLGAALAQHFTSAVLQGDRYGPRGAGPEMPAGMLRWPWASLKLITFSAPRAGDESWARSLTVDALQAEFFSTAVAAKDKDALSPVDPSIVPRLTARDRPAGYRVLISGDPITTEKVGGGGKHVGKAVYVDRGSPLGSVVGFTGHEPEEIRRYLIDWLDDPAAPPPSWAYRAPESMVPAPAAERGSAADARAQLASLIAHHAKLGEPVDIDQLEADLAQYLALLPSR